MGSTKYNIKTRLLTIALLGFFFGFLYSQQQVSAYSETDNHNQYIAPAPGGNLQATIKIATTEVRDLGNTVRVDPLDKFKKYRGGFDIKNKHYWSSTLFTGIYGYAIAVFGILLGLVYGVTLLSTALCCKTKKSVKNKKRQFYCSSRYCSLWPIFLGTALTVLAIAASGVVLGGSSKFHSNAKTIMHIIVDTADGASDTIHNVTGAMRNIPDNLGRNQNKTGTFGFPNSTTEKLDTEASEIRRQAKKNRDMIEKGLSIMYITTTVVVTLNLIALIALSVAGILKFRRVIYMLIIISWLLAVLCWAYFGLYYSIAMFLGDTCTALKDFQLDPNNSSLSSIVPCDELRSAKSVLLDTRIGIYNLINQVNAKISALRPLATTDLMQVCNPFTAPPEYNYQPANCPANTIQITDIPRVVKILSCSVGAPCDKGNFMSGELEKIEAYTSSIQNLLDAFPGVESLVDCQVVKDAFTEILAKHCKPVKKSAKMVWSALVVLSSLMVVLVSIWIITAFHDSKHHFAQGSILPQLAGTKSEEFELPNASINKSEFQLEP
ncbi:hypothetical protein C5167_016329 [Papaver somniferum]|uniref:uncharacterized protein LOC113343851 n=1 Tax=Papaver somniferum TaxID=3469 RepID=UPI000E6FACBB|nr:uncharacterized protein LOC113343851 [Papaver somniferum]RZC93699.1 hypothetical protein C5167_016329 [Papaver somniferum]